MKNRPNAIRGTWLFGGNVLCGFVLCFSGELDDREWRFLLTGGVALTNPFPNPARDWLTDKSWSEIVRCSEIPALKGFMDHFKNNVSYASLSIVNKVHIVLTFDCGRILRPLLFCKVTVAVISSPSPLFHRRPQMRAVTTHLLHLCSCSELSRPRHCT